MTEQDALDAAAQSIGYPTFAEASSNEHGSMLLTLRNYANAILARQAAERLGYTIKLERIDQ